MIKKLVVDEFEYETRDLGWDYGFNMVWRPGNVMKGRGSVLRIFTEGGPVGEVGGSVNEYLAHFLLGKNALAREYLWSNIWRGLRHSAGAGLASIDLALWDIAGKYYDAPVHELLGYYRKELPCYASTYHADDVKDGLSSPEAYADFAEECLKIGYPAFKIHGWGFDTPARIKQEVATIHAVRERVGDKMNLMIDPACEYPTFANALEVGRACDEEGFFWYEDPFRDGGVSAFAHRKLRQLIKTPLLISEHLRTVYPKVDFIVAEGTDFVRGDIEKDGGITGVMKVAHAAEGFGLDIELHGGGIACQQCMAAIRNTNYLEWGLVHPKLNPEFLHAVDSKGCIKVPEEPGLGEKHDWDYITKHRTATRTYE
ncbi:MAG: enolase C-terminal domain-like protein [Candidatus Bathyarchaeia archaeon]